MGAEFQRMGGAALLRNAKHHFNRIVKNHRDSEKDGRNGRRVGKKR